MTRHSKEFKAEIERRPFEPIVIFEGAIEGRQTRLEGGPGDHGSRLFPEGLHAANMISMMMREQNEVELHPKSLQGLKHGLCFARIHHSSVAFMNHQPEVIVRKCWDGVNRHAVTPFWNAG